MSRQPKYDFLASRRSEISDRGEISLVEVFDDPTRSDVFEANSYEAVIEETIAGPRRQYAGGQIRAPSALFLGRDDLIYARDRNRIVSRDTGRWFALVEASADISVSFGRCRHSLTRSHMAARPLSSFETRSAHK